MRIYCFVYFLTILCIGVVSCSKNDDSEKEAETHYIPSDENNDNGGDRDTENDDKDDTPDYSDPLKYFSYRIEHHSCSRNWNTDKAYKDYTYDHIIEFHLTIKEGFSKTGIDVAGIALTTSSGAIRSDYYPATRRVDGVSMDWSIKYNKIDEYPDTEKDRETFNSHAYPYIFIYSNYININLQHCLLLYNTKEKKYFWTDIKNESIYPDDINVY